MENTLQTKQEIANYFIQGVTTNSKIFIDQSSSPMASHLTLDDTPHSITSFLRRPVDLYNFRWTTGDVANKELIPDGLEFPDILLKIKPLFAKLKNFVGLRGEVTIRIKINPQKFQQGLLYAYFLPNTDILNQKVSMIQASLAGKTGCPGGTQINCEGGTLYDITIPYVSQFNFYNLLSDQGNYGKLFLTPILPLKSITQNDYVDVQIQAFWKDPQLVFATGCEPAIVPTQMEQQMLHGSNTLETGGSSFIGNQDLITTLIENPKPSTVLKTGANLMQLAGYQKPAIETGVTLSHLQTNQFMANYNGEQFCHSMGLSSTNKLASVTGPTSTNADEQVLSNIFTKSCFYKTFEFSSSNTNGQILFHDEVYPSKFAPSETENVYNSTFVGYVSAPFSMWQGSMVYRFTCAKTQFHSGAIRVSWVPGLYDEDFNGNIITKPNFDINMNHNETFDLRAGEINQFEFVVPFSAATPALLNINPYSQQAKKIAKYNWCAGSIVVEVFTELRAPDSVSQTMDIATFVSGGADLQLMGPSVPVCFPYSSIVQTQGIIDEEDQLRNTETQQQVQPVTGSLKSDYLASALLTGECVASVKNFLARQGLYGQLLNPASTVIKICAFDFQDPLSTFEDNVKNFDFLDYFSYLYGWYAGGIYLSMHELVQTPRTVYEVKMIPSCNGYYPDNFDRLQALSGSELANYDSTLNLLPYATQVIRSSLEGMVHISVPYTNRVQITPCMTSNQTQNLVEEGSYPGPIIYVKGNPGNLQGFKVYRSVKDDFNFHYLLGPPQVAFFSNTAIPSPFLYPNILMDDQSQAVTLAGANTIKVAPFFQYNSQNFVVDTVYPIKINTQFISRLTLTVGGDWALAVVPGNDTYSFKYDVFGKLNLSHPTYLPADWELYTGSFSPLSIGSTTVFSKLVESGGISEPIQFSIAASTTCNITGTTGLIVGFNNNLIMTTGNEYNTTDNVLALELSTNYPVVIAKGTLIKFQISNIPFFVANNKSYTWITSFDDGPIYNVNVTVKPYVLNTPL